MSSKSVPAKRLFTCDGCGLEQLEPDNGMRPSRWSQVHFRRDAYDFQGRAVADASVLLDFCALCTQSAAEALNGVKAK